MKIEIDLINQWGTDNFCILNLSAFNLYETGMTKKGVGFIIIGIGIDVARIEFYG